MIVINNGVPKSATTLILEYQMDLITISSLQNGIEAFRKRNDDWLWVSTFTGDILKIMLDVEAEFGSFAIKTHRPPEENTKRLVEEFGAKVTCCYRDPRDNVLSAMDHGVRTRAGGDSTGAFGDIVTIEDGAQEVKKWVNIYRGWREYGQVLLIKYEDIMRDKLAVLSSMATFFDLELDEQELRHIYEKHEGLKDRAPNFNKGTCERWRTEMSDDDVAMCNDILFDEITLMGYPLE